MKKITKKQGKEFVDKVCKGLIELGAKAIIDSITTFTINFELETKVGRLEIHVPKEQNYCYTVFSRFDDVEKAKLHFPCNPNSGKYNIHESPIPVQSAVDIALAIFKQTLSK